jgi:hypothetical protein
MAAITTLAASVPTLDHSEVLRFAHAVTDARFTDLEQATIEARQAAAQAVIDQIQAIERAVPAADGGDAIPQFDPFYLQAFGFTTTDPGWARSALKLMLRTIHTYSTRLILGDTHYRTMFRNACTWGARMHSLFPTVDFGTALPHISHTSATVTLGDLPILHTLFAFPILDQLYTVVCRQVSSCWVNLKQELLLAGSSPAPTDGNGWACLFTASLQRHLEFNVPREVVADRRATAQQAGVTADMTDEEIHLWMTTAAQVATPRLASTIVDPRNDAGARPATQRGDSLNSSTYIVLTRSSAICTVVTSRQSKRTNYRFELCSVTQVHI